MSFKLSDFWKVALASFVASSALVAATLANFLSYNSYPLFRPEVGLLATGAVVLTAIMALVYAGQRQWGRSFLEGAIAALFVDFNVTAASGLHIAIVALGVFAYTFFRTTTLVRPLAFVGVVNLLASTLGFGMPSGWMRSTKAQSGATTTGNVPEPALLHIILDEHIGMEAIPLGHPDGARLKEELTSFYLDRRFALYGRAYSEHLHTINAVPHILNYGAINNPIGGREGVEVGPTVHFQNLANQGFRLKILQSSFAELCSGSPFADCTTYSASSPAATLTVPMSSVERAQLLMGKLLKLSLMSSGSKRAMRVAASVSKSPAIAKAVDRFSEADWSSSVGGLIGFNRLILELGRARPGDAYFAHILAPHFPYIVREDCSYLPWEQWKSRHTHIRLADRQQAYFNQVRCTTAKLDKAIGAFSRSPAGRNTVVIVHGDHGSRLSERDANEPNLGKFGAHDLIAGFPTLFAIKGPHIPATYVEEAASVADLLRNFAASQFSIAPMPKKGLKHGVILDDEAWRPTRRHPLPDY